MSVGFDLTKEDINIVQEVPFGTDQFVHIDDWNAQIVLDENAPQAGTWPGSILTEWSVEKLNNNGLYEAVNFVAPDGYQAVGDATYVRAYDGRVLQQMALLKMDAAYLTREIFFGRMTPEEIAAWDTFVFSTPAAPDWLLAQSYSASQFAEWRQRNVTFNAIERSLIVQQILAHFWGIDRANVLLAADDSIPYNWNPYAIGEPN